jgi:hypothetical protein
MKFSDRLADTIARFHGLLLQQVEDFSNDAHPIYT